MSKTSSSKTRGRARRFARFSPRPPKPRPAALLAGLLVLGAACATPAAEGREDPKVQLTPQRIQARIRKHRTAEVTLTLTDAAGRPLAGKPVTVRQTRHKFLFGCNAFRINPADTTKLQADYQNRFAELLNFATLPFYWGAYERQPGRTDARRVRAMAEWCKSRGIRTKGHPLCWHQVRPRWGDGRELEEMQRLQLRRITREVSGFAGLIDTWDVVNEAVIMPSFQRDKNPITALCRKLGRVGLIQQTFAVARKANPKATLLLNDFDTSARYAELIEKCLKAGVKIDVIGIQSHMHGGYRGARWAWGTCERFAKFGKPLHFTELTITSGEIKRNIRWHGPRYTDWVTTPEGEKRQAEQAAEFYTVLFSHPAVEAITWWDFSDHAWLGAPSGLVRKDMSPKPAYQRLLKLVKGKWWTAEAKLTTDASGRATFRGFLGSYAVQSAAGKGRFALDKPGKLDLAVKLK